MSSNISNIFKEKKLYCQDSYDRCDLSLLQSSSNPIPNHAHVSPVGWDWITYLFQLLPPILLESHIFIKLPLFWPYVIHNMISLDFIENEIVIRCRWNFKRELFTAILELSQWLKIFSLGNPSPFPR